ncbi:MAG: DNA topoisomerase IV subunit A [Acholeplasmatales bacterium]|nr:DNA topoisomerase IV subunit A [Acholeplasmatales bacterium]
MADIKKKLDKYINETFEYEKLEDVIGDRFGRYSKYIIQDRAIPDVRDGLKPVQRRILYGMNKMGITSKSPYKKSARIVGEVMGKYHPHGDSSIYDAMVHLSQNWKMGVTLIDMHGNNGSIDGDGAAAMRYTEARLSKNADYLLKDIDKNTVPFVPNFDEEEMEPTVLPGLFPNLLVNGAMGISSGFATYIPTHNLSEVINATIARIENPNMTLDDLLEIMPGPDFPTGGIIEGLDGIREAFNTGSGSVIVRCKYEFEEMGKDQQRIVITEIPYDTNKAKTVEKIDQMRIDHKIEDVLEVRDESDRSGLRIAIDLKKGANAQANMNYLLKNTDLQVNLKYNMVVINNRRPERIGVLRILDAYIDHQKEVFTNKTQYDKAKAEARLEVVDGLIRMVSILDEVIATIRKSANRADAKQNLIDKFQFTERQSEAIITMQLYRLSNTDVVALQEEHDTLVSNIARYEEILGSEKKLLKEIKHDLIEMGKDINQERRTAINADVTDLKIDETDLISKETVHVVVTRDGYIKRISLKAWSMSTNNNIKPNDSVVFSEDVSTLDTLLLFSDGGNYCSLPVYKIDECKAKDAGMFINNIITIVPKEKFIQVFKIESFTDNKTLLLATADGAIKQTALASFELKRWTKAVKCMKIGANDALVSVDMITKPMEIICATKNCECIRYRALDVPMYGTAASGLKSLKLKPNDKVVSSFYANKDDDILLLTSRGFIKRMKVEELNLSARGRSSSAVIKKIKSNPHVLVDAKKLTPNQYKENVDLNVCYTNGNDTLKVFDFKYNVADAGKQVLNKELGVPTLMFVASPEVMDADVDDAYLLQNENPMDLFSNDFVQDEPKIKANTKSTKSVISDLDAILASVSTEAEKPEIIETNDSVVKKSSSSTIVRKKMNDFEPKKKNDGDIPFKTVNLFGDDNDEE